jgi:hypothetical protein
MDDSKTNTKTDLEKAREVCKEAFPKKEPPDDKTLAEAGHKLSSATTWFEVRQRAAKKSTVEEIARERYPMLTKLAREAAELLGANDLAARSLQEAADEAFEIGHTAPLPESITKKLNSLDPVYHGILPPEGISPRELYIFDLADIFEWLSKDKAGVTGDGKDGPFTRFAQKAAEQFDATHYKSGKAIDVPRGTIAEALRKRRMGKQS